MILYVSWPEDGSYYHHSHHRSQLGNVHQSIDMEDHATFIPSNLTVVRISQHLPDQLQGVFPFGNQT